MRNLLVDLNRYFSKYKYAIGFIVLVVILFLLVTRQYDKMGRKVGDSRNTTISESVSNEISVNQVSNNTDITKVEDVSKYIKTEKDMINAFYMLCNDNKLDLAYEMLTDDCKQVLYPNLEDFKNNYYNVIFKTNKDIEIISFKNNTYRVNFNEEAITMGNAGSKGLTDYVTVTKDNKINISGFIRKEQINVNTTKQYFSAQITEKQVFVDYEVLSFSIKNNIKADIYINDASGSGLYITDSNGKAYYVDSGEYNDYDYYIPAETQKSLTIRFKKQYDDSTTTASINFNNIKIENQKYYEKNNNQQIEKMTSYPDKISDSINFKN